MGISLACQTQLVTRLEVEERMARWSATGELA